LAQTFKILKKVAVNGTTALWGVTAGTNNANVSKYERLSEGDLVVFARDKHIFATAVITYLFRNKMLGRKTLGQRQ